MIRSPSQPISPSIASRTPHRRGLRGVSLVFSLVTLAALSLTAVALIRSVDTGSTILGNLSFKQDTALAADEATRQAIIWLNASRGSATLQANIGANGYIASNVPLLDPTGSSANTARAVIDWASDPANPTCSAYPANSYTGGCLPSRAAEQQATGAGPGGMANGVTARWVIVRLCASPGDPATVSCARPLVASTGESIERDELGGGGKGRAPPPAALSQYFRIIVRAQGGRKTVTYTETILHL
jgi:Tfp pilus assembly protein PilX